MPPSLQQAHVYLLSRQVEQRRAADWYAQQGVLGALKDSSGTAAAAPRTSPFAVPLPGAGGRLAAAGLLGTPTGHHGSAPDKKHDDDAGGSGGAAAWDPEGAVSRVFRCAVVRARLMGCGVWV